MNTSRIVAVDHVHIEAPPGLEERLRWFYGELVRLDEIPRAAGGAWTGLRFRSERIELRIVFASEPDIQDVKSRVTILVPSLPEVTEQCAEHGIGFVRISGVVWTDRRIQVLDPAGNRVELKQAWRYGPI